MINLQNYTIHQYASMLKNNIESNKELISQIDAELSKQLSNFGTGENIALFLLQKDLLVLQCKMALAFLDMDDEIQKKLSKRIEALRKEVERLSQKENKKTPYKSFLTWILSVEKHLQFSINRDNDLEYLVEATIQMLTFYENQKRQLEENKAKR
jgi:hypothetical protein